MLVVEMIVQLAEVQMKIHILNSPFIGDRGGWKAQNLKKIIVPQCIVVNFVCFSALFTEFENTAPFGQN